MKAILLATSILLAAVPATAISHGSCCAKVGNVCISSCPKNGGCTGHADCKLAKPPASSHLDLDTKEGKLALATLKPADRTRLRKIVSGPKEPSDRR